MPLLLLCFLLVFSVADSQTQPQTSPQTQTQTQPQPPPDTDIYILDLTTKNRKFEAGKPQNFTARKGYDNQPSFFTDQELFYTSIREGQADIFAKDLRTNPVRQITSTPESEYSPTMTPDGKFLSVVRVETDETQRLWKFPLKGGPPTLVLENVKPVGYHLWMDENKLLLFILGEPATLQLANVRTGKTEKIVDNIGRSLQKIRGSNAASFVQKNEKNEWWIQQIDLAGNIKPIVKALPTEDHDFTWMPDGTLLMAQDSKLYGYTPEKDADWQFLADLGVHGVTRLAVSPDGKKLAFVAFEK